MTSPRIRESTGTGAGNLTCVDAVVDDGLDVDDHEGVAQEDRRERHGEVAVRDCCLERPVLRALDIEVDPLMVVAGVGKKG